MGKEDDIRSSAEQGLSKNAALISTRLVLTVIAGAVAMVLDAVTPLGLAVWLLQVVLVWSASLWGNDRQIITIAIVCSSFIVLGFWLSPKTALAGWVDFSNVLLGLIATGAIAHTCLRQRATAEASRRAEEIARQAQAAQRHQELKSMLLDALAHEFQTPLTSIGVAIAAMSAESPNREQQEWLEIMDQERARISSMIVETMQMARIDAGQVDLDKQIHTVDDLVHSALERELTEASHLEIDLSSGLPVVSADVGLIRLVIRQVVGNALKYSRPGAPIRLCARTEENRVIISVSDGGPGMSQEEKDRAFEKYYRGQLGNSHPTGMGIGLSIARQVTEAHGGNIWIDSVPGEGTTVSFTLPFAQDP